MSELVGLAALLALAALVLLIILVTTLVREARRPPRHTAGYAVARGLAVDPGELGMRFESWTVRRPDGAVLPVWEVTTTAPRLDGRPLTAVFVHGWGHSRIDALARVGAWARLADRLVLYDLRGHGDSEGCLSRLGSGEAGDLAAILERIDGDVVLVGHSMGAAIALEAAAAAARDGEPRGARIAGVVVHGPYVDFHESLRGRLRRSGLPSRPFTDLALAWLRLFGIRHGDPLRDAAALACPLLVIHGADDPVCPLEQARGLADAAADGALVEVHGAAHLDAHLVDPALVDRSIESFVRRLDEANPLRPDPPL